MFTIELGKINSILHSQQSSKSYNFGKSPTGIDSNNLLPVSTASTNEDVNNSTITTDAPSEMALISPTTTNVTTSSDDNPVSSHSITDSTPVDGTVAPNYNLTTPYQTSSTSPSTEPTYYIHPNYSTPSMRPLPTSAVSYQQLVYTSPTIPNSSTIHSTTPATSYGSMFSSAPCTSVSTNLPLNVMAQPFQNQPQCTFPYNSNNLQSNYTMYPVAPPLVPTTQPPLPSSTHPVNISPSNQDTTVRLKRMSLPTFSGLRKDWPEFKAVWRSMAESANYNKTALAHELKSSVRGVAKHRIKSVYITKPEAYDMM